MRTTELEPETMEIGPETMEAGPETMEALRDDGDKAGNDGDEAGDDLLIDRAVLGARVRWEPNLTESERESGSLFLLFRVYRGLVYIWNRL